MYALHIAAARGWRAIRFESYEDGKVSSNVGLIGDTEKEWTFDADDFVPLTANPESFDLVEDHGDRITVYSNQVYSNEPVVVSLMPAR